MHYLSLGLFVAVSIPCALASTTTPTSKSIAAPLISIPTSLYYSTSIFFITVHLPSAICLESSTRRTTSSSETSTSEVLPTANPSSKSLSSSSNLHISSDFYGDRRTSITSSIVPSNKYPSETRALSDGSSSFTPSSTTSTSSTCSSTLRSTDPCPELLLKDDFLQKCMTCHLLTKNVRTAPIYLHAGLQYVKFMQDSRKPDHFKWMTASNIMLVTVEKCREFQASLVGPNPTYDGRYGLIESPEFSNMG